MITLTDLMEYMGIDAGEVSQRRFELLLAETVALITAYAPKLTDVDPWPDSAVSVALRVMSRSLQAELRGFSGVSSVSEGAGEFSQSLTFSDSVANGGLWLSKQDKLLLRGFAGASAYAVNLMPKDTLRYPPTPEVWNAGY